MITSYQDRKEGYKKGAKWLRENCNPLIPDKKQVTMHYLDSYDIDESAMAKWEIETGEATPDDPFDIPHWERVRTNWITEQCLEGRWWKDRDGRIWEAER